PDRVARALPRVRGLPSAPTETGRRETGCGPVAGPPRLPPRRRGSTGSTGRRGSAGAADRLCSSTEDNADAEVRGGYGGWGRLGEVRSGATSTILHNLHKPP